MEFIVNLNIGRSNNRKMAVTQATAADLAKNQKSESSPVVAMQNHTENV